MSADILDAPACSEIDREIGARRVTAMSIRHEGFTVALPSPRRFHDYEWGFEAVGNPVVAESIYAQAGDVRVSLTRALDSQVVRCDVTRTGHSVYHPRRDKERKHANSEEIRTR